MSQPFAMGAAALAQAVRGGALTARDALDSVLARIAALNGPLNAFRLILPERARSEAAAVDAAIAAGRDPGPLAGVPYGVKDLFDVEGGPTVAGSKINLSHPPAARDGVLVARLRAAGAVLVGLQVMDEYAYGFTTENVHHGDVHNPRALAHSAGGSSGGSAAAVAAGLGAFSLGSDTNGSIRVPASFCGVFGLKPTFGRIPRSGSFPFVYDLDHLGPFARHVRDLALVYDVIQGPDPGDPGCAGRPVEAVSGVLDDEGPLRAAVLDGWFETLADDQGRAAVAAVAQALQATERATLQGAEVVRSAAFLISAASGANLHRASLRDQPQDFDPATRGRLLAGAFIPAAEVIQAQRLRRRVHEEALRLFDRFDVLLAPATPCAAPRLRQPTIVIDGQEVPTRPNLGLLAQPISAIGLPALTVPVLGSGAGLPIGVQIIAPPWREDRLFQVAARLERAGVVSAPVAQP